MTAFPANNDTSNNTTGAGVSSNFLREMTRTANILPHIVLKVQSCFVTSCVWAHDMTTRIQIITKDPDIGRWSYLDDVKLM